MEQKGTIHHEGYKKRTTKETVGICLPLSLSAANVSQPSVTQNTDVYSSRPCDIPNKYSRPSDIPNKYSEAIDGYFILTEI
jgi:hypothetical protein